MGEPNSAVMLPELDVHASRETYDLNRLGEVNARQHLTGRVLRKTGGSLQKLTRHHDAIDDKLTLPRLTSSGDPTCNFVLRCCAHLRPLRCL